MARLSMRLLTRFPSSSFSSSSSPPYCRSLSSFPRSERPVSTCHPGVDFLKSRIIARPHLFQIQAQLITSGLFHAYSRTLLEHSSNSGDIVHTLLLFKHTDSFREFCVNNVIKAYSFSSIPHHALVFYQNMLHSGFFPNSHTFVWIFRICAKFRNLTVGQNFHAHAVKHGVVDCVLPVQNSLIHLYGRCGAVEFGRKMFDEMHEKDLVSWNSLVGAYVNVDLIAAHELFDIMHERNVVSWNILISGYLKGNKPGCAIMLFRRMVSSGLRGNDMTITSVVTACSRSARLKEGRSVHGFTVRRFLKLNIVLETSLIDMYSKCGKVNLARRVFDTMVNRNLICWNAMISGHCIHGNPYDGLQLFSKMVGCSGYEEGIHPDEVTYIAVLCACARAGLVTEGRFFFNQMVDLYALKPNFAHHWCMADLYANAGLLQEAEDILRIIPEYDEEQSLESLMWANLLILSRFQANATFGERIAKSLIAKEPWNFQHYRLLLNVYAVAGQWDDVNRVKEMVKERKVGKMPGSYLVDLKEIVHDYKVGHRWPEGTDEVSAWIDEMAERRSL